MKMREILERDKENILSAVAQAESGTKRADVCGDILSKLLYTFNENEKSEKVKQSAYNVIAGAKSACLFLDCGGEVEIWSKTNVKGKNEKKERSKSFLPLAVAGPTVTLAGLIYFSAAQKVLNNLFAGGGKVFLLLAAGLILTFFAGINFKKPKEKDTSQLYTQAKPDGQKVYRALLAVATAADKIIEETRQNENIAQKKEIAETNGGIDNETIELMYDLLQTCYTAQNTDMGKECISFIKYFLHSHFTDVLDYTGDNGEFFTMMPGDSVTTLCPALVQEGRVLKKGLAVGGL
jgi:hypothetical protein